jgi:hypothetical protein
MGKPSKIKVKMGADFSKATDQELIQYRAALEVEMRRRHLGFSVGQIGELLVIEHFNRTPGLPKLLRSPIGTKNVDALSRNGDRYSIKTIWNAKKTGTIYPDSSDKNKQLFEYLIISQLSDDLTLKNIYEFSWQQFVKVRSWDKRMNAWYIGCSRTTLSRSTCLLNSDNL